MSEQSTPLVLLPGLDGTGDFFADFASALPGDVEPRVERYPRDEPLDYAGLLARVEPTLPRGRPFVLVGESFSGPLSLLLAARRPVGLVGLVLVATFHRDAVAKGLDAVAGWVRPALFSRRLPGVALRALLAGWDAPSSLVREFQSAMATVRPEVLAARARAALTVDATAAAREVAVPTLYLAASREGLMRRELPDELALLVPDFRVAHVDTAHLVLQREPREAARVVAEFVRDCVAGGAAAAARRPA